MELLRSIVGPHISASSIGTYSNSISGGDEVQVLRPQGQSSTLGVKAHIEPILELPLLVGSPGCQSAQSFISLCTPATTHRIEAPEFLVNLFEKRSALLDATIMLPCFIFENVVSSLHKAFTSQSSQACSSSRTSLSHIV